jgi:hypothetical protein
MFAAGAATLILPATATAQTATKLNCNGCVGNKQLGNKAVTNKKIKPGTIKNKNLGKDAKAAGVAFVGPTDAPSINGQTQVAFVSLAAPGNGYAVVNASGAFAFTGTDTVECEITEASSTDSTNSFSTRGASATIGTEGKAFGATRVFPVSGGGNTVIKLVCTANGSVSANNVFMNAIFVPNDY